MEVAKITSKGQITIPVDVRRKMNLKDGDKVIFLEQDGRVYVENAALVAITHAQEAFAGEAKRRGLKDEQDVVDMVKEVRRTRRGK
jgi:AbrB family looped-hinge helix DNA binding protein